MIRPSSIALALVASSTLALFASPSFADTTIKVVEGGEGGGPMTLALDTATAKAGPITFVVHNDAVSEGHEMVVVKLKSADQKIPFNKKKDRVNEKKLNSFGEVSDLKPGTDGTLKTTLEPGTYLLFCNIKGHYAAGMQAKFVVTP
jgi:uncharacterized cupredoxin-like copper-binding protein